MTRVHFSLTPMSDTVIYSLNISLKMYLRSDWFIQELRYIKYPVHFNWWSRFLNWDVLSIQYQAEKNGNKYPKPNSPNYHQKNWMAMVRLITKKILGIEEFKTGGAFSGCLQFHNFLQGQLFLRHISKLLKKL